MHEGLQRSMGIAEMAKRQAEAYANSSQGLGYSDRPKEQSPIEQSLDRLAGAIDTMAMNIQELHGRLEPIVCPVPCEEKTGSQIRGSACQIEGRIEDMVEKVANLTQALRYMREGLRI